VQCSEYDVGFHRWYFAQSLPSNSFPACGILENGTKLSLDQYLSLVSDWEEAMAVENHA
jgi:hypothetical protein